MSNHLPHIPVSDCFPSQLPNKISRRLAILRYEIKVSEEQIATLISRNEVLIDLCNELAAQICNRCGGKGQVLIHYSHDDAKYVMCNECKGTGLKNV